MSNITPSQASGALLGISLSVQLMAPVAKIKIGTVSGKNNKLASKVLFLRDNVRLEAKAESKVRLGLPSKMVYSKVMSAWWVKGSIALISGARSKIGK